MPSHELDLLDGNPFLVNNDEIVVKDRFKTSLKLYREELDQSERADSTAAIWPSKVMPSVSS